MHKIIIAGCGNRSRIWIDNIIKRENCKIVGLVDVNPAAINEKKEKYGLDANGHANISDALKKEDADLVIDVTVPDAHLEVVTSALKAGCNVFGEKPMSDTLENAEKMVECAEQTKKDYFVMQNRRYLPAICGLKNFLKSEQLGKIGQISAVFQLGPRFGGFRDEMESPLVADMAIHTFDQARFITGKNAVSVYCHEFNPHWSWYKGSANAVCIFEMDDGSVFDYRGSWCTNGLNTSWESEWRIACTKGVALWDGAEKLCYECDFDLFKGNNPGVNAINPTAMETRGDAACIDEMFDALKNKTRAQTDCRDNINSIRMVYKAIESARLQKKIRL